MLLVASSADTFSYIYKTHTILALAYFFLYSANSGSQPETAQQTSNNQTMDNNSKLALFEDLIIYLIQSSNTMTLARKALASNPLFTSQIEWLNTSLDSAKVLLSKV